MTNLSRILATAFLAVSAAAVPVFAQTDDAFDLSSQRSEDQSVNGVPGHYIGNRPVVINPVPRQLDFVAPGILNISKGFSLKGNSSKEFEKDLSFLTLNPKGAKLTITYGPQAADKAGVKPEAGAYSLTIDKKGVEIVGRDERGAFYGIQTLRQILENPGMDQALPELTINDWPNLPNRGVVEGFYGTPWSHEVRLSLIDFYGRHKMNTYLYGPKDDPYHSTPNWRLPYPPDEEKKIRELVEASKRNRVDFVWAIHPGKDIKWNEEDYQNLVNKFNMMYDLGVRSFAIFFDDIEGEGTNPVKQTELLNRLTDDFIKPKGDVSNLVMCPTDYSRLWANPGPNGSLATFGRTLNKAVEIMNTGDVVCSDLTREGQEFFSNLTQRPGYYWWNYPVTDYGRMYLLQGPVYGLDTTLTTNDIVAIVSNPMEHGEASKLALYGVADYGWNTPKYNPIDNWERGLRELAPNAYEAYRTFAINSCDTETGYRRAESWETPTVDFEQPYAPRLYKILYDQFDAITRVPQQLEENMENKLLLGELRPWLVEFGKLGQRGKRALELKDIIQEGNDSTFWGEYVANMMTPEDMEAYKAHKSGTMKLQPFYENAMTSLIKGYYIRLTGKTPLIYKGVGTYPNLSTNLDRNMLDGDTLTHYTSANQQKAEDWIGLDLMEVRPLSAVNIRQGRNSVDDGDYYEIAMVEASADGRTWKALTDTLVKVYDIAWSSTDPVDARYVRLRRLPGSDKKSWASIRTFEVIPADLPASQPEILIGIEEKAAKPAEHAAFDQNPTTPYNLNGSFSFKRPREVKEYVVLADLKPAQSYTVTYTDAQGNSLGSRNVTTPYATLTLPSGADIISLAGEATIYEMLPR